jgi:hypothetical protein
MPPVPSNPEPEQKAEIKKNDHNSSTTDASVASTTGQESFFRVNLGLKM